MSNKGVSFDEFTYSRLIHGLASKPSISPQKLQIKTNNEIARDYVLNLYSTYIFLLVKMTIISYQKKKKKKMAIILL
jgi:hypothetical protein